jgi:hypothetical protein
MCRDRSGRYYVGHKGKFGHEFLEFEFRPDGLSMMPQSTHSLARSLTHFTHSLNHSALLACTWRSGSGSAG